MSVHTETTEPDAPIAEAPVLTASGLSKNYDGPSNGIFRRSHVRAVSELSLELHPGRTVSIVGESGCGKTSTARLLLGLEKPTRGSVYFRGLDLAKLNRQQRREYRSVVQAVFQDPSSALDPRWRIGTSVAEPLKALGTQSRAEIDQRVLDLLTSVGLDPSHAHSYPHELSGGMRQRVAIAQALATSPELVILDEPVSALDVSIRAQIMNLLKDVQRDSGVAYLLIAHDLATVRYMSADVIAMFLGSIVETGPTSEVFARPAHPYTMALLSAVTRLDRSPAARPRILLEGDPPSPANPPSGCAFHTRCSLWKQLGKPESCTSEVPARRMIESGRSVACHFAERLSADSAGAPGAGSSPAASASGADDVSIV